MALGVVVHTGTLSGPAGGAGAPGATYFVPGLAERGPVDRVVTVRSIADYEAIFGKRPSYGSLYDDLRVFFEEGGQKAVVARVVGAAATVGALSAPLRDRGESSGQPTLNVVAAGPGAWSSAVTVEIVDGSIDDTFTIKVRDGGLLVESYPNLRSPQEAVSKTSGSNRIVVQDLASETAAPANNPAVTAPVALAAGTDDRASVLASNLVAALDRFPPELGSGAVAIPGAGDASHAGLIAHAEANNRIALLSTERGAEEADLAALASSYDSPSAGLFGPWLRVTDGFGGTRAISPEGYVAACRARSHVNVGPWQAAAGERARSRYIVGIDTAMSRDTLEALYEAKVNSVIVAPGTGVMLYGWRSLSEDVANWEMLSGVDVVNTVVVAARERLGPYVFGTIDSRGHLLAAIQGSLEGILAPMAQAGGLYAWVNEETGEQEDPGYVVNTSGSVNTREALAANRVLATIALRVAPSAALVDLTVTKAGVTARL